VERYDCRFRMLTMPPVSSIDVNEGDANYLCFYTVSLNWNYFIRLRLLCCTLYCRHAALICVRFSHRPRPFFFGFLRYTKSRCVRWRLFLIQLEYGLTSKNEISSVVLLTIISPAGLLC